MTSEALWALGRGNGIVALAFMTISVALGIATRSGRPLVALPRFAVADVHRFVALAAVLLCGTAGAQPAATASATPAATPGRTVVPLKNPSFEPDATTLFESLLPRYVATRIFAALLEAAASESASRRRAMKAASDNADDLIKALTLMANRERQAQITQEISEIVGGANALADAK